MKSQSEYLVLGVPLDDEATYEILLQEYGPRVLAAVSAAHDRYLGTQSIGMPIAEPEDILQDAILDMLRLRHRLHFRSIDEAGRWLMNRAQVWWEYRRGQEALEPPRAARVSLRA